MIDRTDLRLKAAELSEQEFTGTLHIHPDADVELLDIYREQSLWTNLPAKPLIEAREGYVLRYASGQRAAPLAFLVFENQLVGVFESDTLMIDPLHRKKHLSRELILAGFAQAPWKDLQNRKVTEAGAAALRSAHKFATEVAQKLNGK